MLSTSAIRSKLPTTNLPSGRKRCGSNSRSRLAEELKLALPPLTAGVIVDVERHCPSLELRQQSLPFLLLRYLPLAIKFVAFAVKPRFNPLLGVQGTAF